MTMKKNKSIAVQNTAQKTFLNKCEKSLYSQIVEVIVRHAMKITNAQVGVLFLSYDEIFLEAAFWLDENSKNRPAAAELPTYILDWSKQDKDAKVKKIGITSFVAIKNETVMLNGDEVFDHPAHAGKWDAVFLEGERRRCKGVLATPLTVLQKDENNLTNRRCIGVLKVENSKSHAFKNEDKFKLEAFSENIAQYLSDETLFWQEHIRTRQMQKPAQLVELLERGRPLSENLDRCLNFLVKLFAGLLALPDAAHFMCSTGDKMINNLGASDRCAYFRLGKWDRFPNKGQKSTNLNELLKKICLECERDVIASTLPTSRVENKSNDIKRAIKKNFKIENEVIAKFVVNKLNLLGNYAPPTVVQRSAKFPNLHDIFTVAEYKGLSEHTNSSDLEARIQQLLISEDTVPVDVIRLRTEIFDFGVILLPIGNNKVCKKGRNDEEEQQITEDLTKITLNLAYILGRFVRDEYEAAYGTYLPNHMPHSISKTCAIMFADMRNFSTLTQILRLTKGHENEPVGYDQVKLFVKNFCHDLGKSISNKTTIGRTEKFMGDGLVALFGEYLDTSNEKNVTKNEENVAKMAVAAILTAFDMLKTFEELHKTWMNDGLAGPNSEFNTKEKKAVPLKQILRTHNENVDIRLAIGINIGEIYFDYFGSKGHFEYTAIGDPMNFTQRLENSAARQRWPNEQGKSGFRANILVSQTAYVAIKNLNCKIFKKAIEPIWLPLKGLGLEYPVYEVTEDIVDIDASNILLGPYLNHNSNHV